MVSGAQPVPQHLSELGHKFAGLFGNQTVSLNDEAISQCTSDMDTPVARSEGGFKTNSPTLH